LGSGLAVTAWGLNAGQKESVLSVAKPIPRGHVVERGDLVSVSVSGVDGAFPLDELDRVVDATTTVDLVAGQIVTQEMLTSSPVPAAGESVVGLALDPARVPSDGLDPGDVVDVVVVPAADAQGAPEPEALETPEFVARQANVYAVDGVADQGGQLLLTLVVTADDAARVAAYSAQNRLAVIETAPDPDVTASGSTS
jgi:hypothetical protein